MVSPILIILAVLSVNISGHRSINGCITPKVKGHGKCMLMTDTDTFEECIYSAKDHGAIALNYVVSQELKDRCHILQRPSSDFSVHENSTYWYQGKECYTEVLEKSILFYEAQRSGHLPLGNRIPWRGDSALNDGSDVDKDLTGGWYDAGDHVKFNFPMAYTVTTLAWGMIDFKSGYEEAGQLENGMDSIKWPLDYFIKCHSDTDPNILYAQVGDPVLDHGWWGRPENMTMSRPSYKISRSSPGSDLAAETAAAFAAGSILFNNTNPDYASTLLEHAKQLYDFAYEYKGTYPTSKGYYVSSGYKDELCWGAAWLYRATNDSAYLSKALKFYTRWIPYTFSWNVKIPGCQMLMYILTNQSEYAAHVKKFIKSFMPNGSLPKTPKGLVFRNKWGPLRHAANAAFIALMADKYNIMPSESREWAKTQIDYMLGGAGRSYVVGFGYNPPKQPHHRSASCDPRHRQPCNWSNYHNPGPNPSIIAGGLVGGPDINDRFHFDRTDFKTNEVACDFNAGFQGALAALIPTDR